MSYPRATVETSFYCELAPGARVEVRPAPVGRGITLVRNDTGEAFLASLATARVEGDVLVLTNGRNTLRGAAPVLAACVAAGVTDLEIAVDGDLPQCAEGFDRLRASIVRAGRRPLDVDLPVVGVTVPVSVSDGRGRVVILPRASDRGAALPVGGEVVASLNGSSTRLPWTGAWRTTADLLAVLALVDAHVEAEVRVRRASMPMLFAAVTRLTTALQPPVL